MSNKSNNEAMVAEQTASTENEIKATIDKYAGLHSDDLNEEQLREFCEALRSLAAMQEIERNKLSESNANLIAEREALMDQVAKLKEVQEAYERVVKYWTNVEERLKLICRALDIIDLGDYMSGRDFIKKIAGF